MTDKHPFKVWINPSCLEKLNFYATEALPTEIGGFAKIEEIGEDVFVTDIFIPEQDATGGTFNITPEMDNEFMRYMMKEGRRDEIKQFKSIVHSHPVGMDPGMSSTDVDAIKRRAEDGECYSLIISASRNADSNNMFMHYCANVYGKKMIWHNIPVETGWEVNRMDKAKKIIQLATDELVGEDATDADRKLITQLMMSSICTSMPPTFEKERKELRAKIREHVKKVVTHPNKYGYGQGAWQYGAAKSSLVNASLGYQTPQERREQGYMNRVDSQSELQKDWEDIQRLYSIGYDKVDPESTDPTSFVTKSQSKKARRLHKTKITRFNKKLRRLGGVGMGDLVVVDPTAVKNVSNIDDLALTPFPAEDFSCSNGLYSYEVDGQLFYGDELIVKTEYEELMGWDDVEAVVPA